VPIESTNPCETAGNAKLYSFRVYCGEGLFDADDDGTSESSVSLGSGVPSDPKLSISAGGCEGPNPNRVIISKQDGEIETEGGPPDFGAGIGQFYWRELSN
jgi:hypothetical protein